MKRNEHFWTEQDKRALGEAKSFVDLSVIALRVLARMPHPVSQVCGPITTGGLGSKEKNLLVFDATIEYLINQGLNVFDQIPFEEHVFRIAKKKWCSRKNNQLLIDFYLPIFQSGYVRRLYFISGWETSEGSRWEHQQGESRRMKIHYMPPQLVQV